MTSDEQQHQTEELHLVFDTASQTLKIGTCEHCVVKEIGRPARAWNANGDTELDFNRDALIAKLAELGIEASIIQEYVCP